MTHAPNVVTFGEMLLRLSPPRYEQFLETPVLTTNFGGCEANVAVGLAHLGIAATHATALPDTPIGVAAVAALQTEGVATRAIQLLNGRMGIYFVELGTADRATRVVYDRAHSAFSTIHRATFDWTDLLNGASWLHSSGITCALGAGPATALADAVATARAAHVPVSVDLNYRPALWTGRDPGPIIGAVIRNIDLLIGNARAVREMLGVDAHDDATATPDGSRDLARHIAATFHVHRVALTRREMPSETEHRWSASLYDARTDSFAASRTHVVRVVDRVGGGDSFAAALIASLLREYPADPAVEFAATAGAMKLAVPGDFNRVSVADVEQAVAQWK